MALREPILAAGATCYAGTTYVVAGKVVTASTTQTVAQWQAALGGSPVIQSFDYIGRRSTAPRAPGYDLLD
jgi:hypothetical protein